MHIGLPNLWHIYNGGAKTRAKMSINVNGMGLSNSSTDRQQVELALQSFTENVYNTYISNKNNKHKSSHSSNISKELGRLNISEEWTYEGANILSIGS